MAIDSRTPDTEHFLVRWPLFPSGAPGYALWRRGRAHLHCLASYSGRDVRPYQIDQLTWAENTSFVALTPMQAAQIEGLAALQPTGWVTLAERLFAVSED